MSPSQAEHKADLLAKFKRGAITRRELVAAAAGMLGGLTIAHDLLPLTHHHPPLAHAAGGIASDNFDRAGPPLGGAWRVRQQDGSDTFFIGSGPNAGKLAQLSWPATTPSGAFALWIDNEFNLTQFFSNSSTLTGLHLAPVFDASRLAGLTTSSSAMLSEQNKRVPILAHDSCPWSEET